MTSRKKFAIGIFFVLLLVAVLFLVATVEACGDSVDCRPTHTPTPDAVVTPFISPTETPTPTPEPSAVDSVDIKASSGDEGTSVLHVLGSLGMALFVVTLLIKADNVYKEKHVADD